MNANYNSEKTKQVIEILNGLSYTECESVLSMARAIIDSHLKKSELTLSSTLLEELIAEEIRNRTRCGIITLPGLPDQ